MLTDPPGRSLLLFALPMIFGNLFQQFYNIADSVIVGNFVGERALAAVGASYAITNVFIAIAIGGGIGSSVIISQCLGAGQKSKMRTAVFTTLINFLVVSICLGALGLFLNHRILGWVNTPQEVFSDAALYLAIYFAGLPFLFMYNVEASIFNALGDSRTPLYLLIFSSLLNIFLDMVFVIQFQQGVRGVAVGTLIAQGVSAVISFGLLLRKLKKYETDEPCRLYDGGLMVSMVRIAVPSIIQQSIVQIGILLVQSVVNRFGASVLAGYSAGMRIESHQYCAYAGNGKRHVHIYGPKCRCKAIGAGEEGLSDVLCDGSERRGVSLCSLSAVWECVCLSIFRCRKWECRFSDRTGLCEISFVLLRFDRIESLHRWSAAGGWGCESIYSG